MLLTHVRFGDRAFDLFGHPGEYIQDIVTRWGLWEPRLTRVIEQILEGATPQEGRVVDCGAHIGYYSMLAASLGYDVVAIEPVFHEEIRQAAERNGLVDKVHIASVALGEAPGRVEMRVFRQTGLSRVMQSHEELSDWHQAKGGGVTRTVANVEMTTLDSLLSDATPVLLMKIDTEGLEPEVLRGFSRGLQRSIARNIVVEMTPRFLGVNTCVAMAYEVCDRGYVCYDLGIAESGRYERTDVLGTLPPLSRDEIRVILSTEPQTNMLFSLAR